MFPKWYIPLFLLITDRCPNDATVKYHSTSSVSAQRFSLEAFKFIADHPFVFVHCHVILCNATEPGSKCAKKCVQGGRGRRDASTQMTDDVYSLVQGPLHLEREKREQKISGAVNKNGQWNCTVNYWVLFVVFSNGKCIAMYWNFSLFYLYIVIYELLFQKLLYLWYGFNLTHFHRT